MSFVLDASVTMAWCFEGETTPYSDAVLDRVRNDGATVPAIWPLEVVNALLVAERRGRVSAEQSAGFAHLLSALPIRVIPLEPDDVFRAVSALGREYGLSAYDASYVRLAMNEVLPMATLDQRLRGACSRAGIGLVS